MYVHLIAMACYKFLHALTLFTLAAVLLIIVLSVGRLQYDTPATPTFILSRQHTTLNETSWVVGVSKLLNYENRTVTAHASTSRNNSKASVNVFLLPKSESPTTTSSFADPSLPVLIEVCRYCSISFSIAKDFAFPHYSIYRPVTAVLASGWVFKLKQFLSSIQSSEPVTITAASYDYLPNLLNWLISAQVVADPPLENVLVVSFDFQLHKLLTRRMNNSIYVPYTSVLKSPHSLGIGRVWMTRMAVMRLINHWGFDVQQFDTDAIILRNPQPVFELYPKSDVVSQRAKLPFELGRGPWGFTMSMGVVLFRASPRTELLWKAIKELRRGTTDDQKRLNFALSNLHLKWQSKDLDVNTENRGIVENSGLQVVVVPPIYFCRGLCTVNHDIDYYVWHEPGGGHDASQKVSMDAKSKVWFLRKDWKKATESELMGRKWLEHLALNTRTTG